MAIAVACTVAFSGCSAQFNSPANQLDQSITYTPNPMVFSKGIAVLGSAPAIVGNNLNSPVTYSSAPALPSGLSIDPTTGAINGTPTDITATAAYTISAAFAGITATQQVTITVNDVAPTNLVYSVNPATYTIGVQIPNNSPVNSGGAVVTYSVSPPLPAGLVLDPGTGVISGTPTVTSVAQDYVITATNTGGNTKVKLNITINDSVPSALAYSTNPAVYTAGSAIVTNTPSNAGGNCTTFSTSPALPPGLSLDTATGKITGTPTAITAYALYTITCSNVAGSTNVALQLTVNDAAPASLGYSTTPAIYTKGSAITTNTPSFTGPLSPTGVTFQINPTLPAGLSFNTANGQITGTPSALAPSGAYTVTATNTGGFTTFALPVTVNDIPPFNLQYPSNPVSYTRLTPIAANVPTTAATGGAVVSYSAPSGLPAGLSLNPSTGVISGTPTTQSGATNYTINATNTGGTVSTSVSMTVNAVAPTGLSYAGFPVTYTTGVAITPVSPSVSGDPVTLYTVNPALPTGLSVDPASGIISGTPTAVTPTSNYVVTAANTGGSTTATLTITVTATPPSNLTYSANPAVYTLNQAISPNVPAASGGTPTSFSLAPTGLPLGLSFAQTGPSAGQITGTPLQLLSTTAYTITATNPGGSTATTVQITVNYPAPSGLAYSAPTGVYTKGSAITNNTPSSSGGPIGSYSVSPALPPGLSLDTTTGIISGTPTQITSANTYTITGSNNGGSTTATINLTVNDVAPSSLVYNSNPATYTKGVLITNNVPTNSGGAIVTYAAPSGLPSGLSLNSTTGVISGTASALQSPTNYLITGTNTGGSTSVTLSIQVVDVPPSNLVFSTNPATYTAGTGITANVPAASGGPITSFSISPAVPTGLSFSTLTGLLTGTPTSISPTQGYTVTATNSGGSTTAFLTITVNDVAPTGFGYTTNPVVFTKGINSTDTPFNSGGGITSYSVTPSLPTGLTLNTTTGVIGGTASVLATQNSYTVIGTNSGGSTAMSLTLTVIDQAPSSLVYTPNPHSLTINQAATINAPSNAGGAVVTYAAPSGLPAGLSLNTSTGQITGTPTVLSVSTPYLITATNTGGTTNTALNIAINDVAPTGLTYSTQNAVYTRASAITTNSPTLAGGGAVTSWNSSPSLPAGLTLNADGTITGTPSVISPTGTYTITATNSGGSATKAITIWVQDIIPSSLAYSPNSVGYTINQAITANSPTSAGGPVVSYSISPALPTGLSFNTTTGVITGTGTVLSPTGSYTVTATNTGGSTTDVLSIAVNDVPPNNITYTSSTNVYVKGTAISTNSPSGNTGGAVISYSVSPALPAGLNLNTSNGQITGTPGAVAANATYTVTATNSGGSYSVNLAIQVNDIPPTSLTYLNCTTCNYVAGTTITNNQPTNSGGAVTLYTSSPAMLTGLTLDPNTGIISGSPGAIVTNQTYTITASNSGGSTTKNIVITVAQAAPTSLSYTPNPMTLYRTVQATTGVPSNGGGVISSYAITSGVLPTGMSFSTTTGQIYGTPTTGNAIGSGGTIAVSGGNSQGTVSVNIPYTVLDAPPANLSYTTMNATYTKGTAITANAPTGLTGGAPTGYSVSPALPAGLTINTSNGQITGTPSAIVGTGSYTVTAGNSGGSTTAVVSITVNDVPPSALAYVPSNTFIFHPGVSSVSGTPTSSGGAVTSYAINPTLPTGLTFDTTTGAIGGNPSGQWAATGYVVTATNSGGSTTDTLTISSTPAPPNVVFVVGTVSPNPPNPDSYGTTNVDVSHTYTLQNTGALGSGTIAVSVTGTNASTWSIDTNNCNSSSGLGPSATCTIIARFKGGNSGLVSGNYSATLQAVAAATGGNPSTTTTNDMTATTAYTWVGQTYNGSNVFTAAASFNVATAPTVGASCSISNTNETARIQAIAAGAQYQISYNSANDAVCTANANGNNYFWQQVGSVRQCGTTTPTWAINPQDFTCENVNSLATPWVGFYTNASPMASNSCDTTSTNIVQQFTCK